jgi:hypothetical protein
VAEPASAGTGRSVGAFIGTCGEGSSGAAKDTPPHARPADSPIEAEMAGTRAR